MHTSHTVRFNGHSMHCQHAMHAARFAPQVKARTYGRTDRGRSTHHEHITQRSAQRPHTALPTRNARGALRAAGKSTNLRMHQQMQKHTPRTHHTTSVSIATECIDNTQCTRHGKKHEPNDAHADAEAHAKTTSHNVRRKGYIMHCQHAMHAARFAPQVHART